MVLLNDGSKAFAAGADPTKLALGSCSISYRNPDDTAYVKVTYKENIITVMHATKKKDEKSGGGAKCDSLLH